MSDAGKPWEPDPQRVGKNWTAMFETPAREQPVPTNPAPAAAETYDDAELAAPDRAEYRPWTLQRGRSRPAMLLDFRRFEPKSGQWSGTSIPYPHLAGMEYTGDTLVSLDFGARQVVIEGRGLDELTRHLQQGTVVAIQEYAASFWGRIAVGPVVTAIRLMAGGDA